MSKDVERYRKIKGYRFPKAIISYVVWLYHRFTLSLRDNVRRAILKNAFQTWDKVILQVKCA